MLTGLHSVVVDVTDFEAGVRDFALLLGRAPARAGEAPQHGRGSAIFTLPSGCLELRSRSERPLVPPALPIRARDGIAGLRFSCTPRPGTALVPGRFEGPSVPIELVAEADSIASPGDSPASGSVVVEPPARPASGPAPSPIDPLACVLALDHVVVATRDPERTRRHLAEELGIRLALDRSFPERGLRLIFFRLGGITLELAAALDGAPADAGPDVFQGLAWKVPRIDAIHARLCAAGFDVSAIRAGHKPGTRVCTVRAPVHGVPTLLIEHPPREGW
jgi:catechol 2,3-dioxygenase-like lactoylglutathione lyase family enzyme